MNFYNINFRSLALLLLPTFLRKPCLAALAVAAVAPLSELHARFMRYRSDVAWRLGHNGQVCYLRGALNDLFDPALRRITVTDTLLSHGLTLVPERRTGEPLLLPVRGSEEALLVGRRGFVLGGFDFVVSIPPGVDVTRVSASVNQFKLASKRFQIV